MSENSESPADPRVIDSRYAFEGRLVKVRLDTVAREGEEPSLREVVEHPGAVLIIAIDERDNVFLVEQYRHPVGRRLWELPAGTLDAREDPWACAERELREETGFTSRALERVGGFFLSPGYSNEYIHVFLATGLEPKPLDTGDEEDLTTVRRPLSDLIQMIERGDIEDAKSIAALMLLSRRRPVS